MIKLVRLHKLQNQTRIQWNPRVKIKSEEITSLDNLIDNKISNDQLTETINFSGQNDDIDLLNLLEQYGVSFPN